jgi:uncharacterized protein
MLRERLRSVERSVYRRALHSGAPPLDDVAPVAWDTAALRAHQFCLIVTYRRDGRAVPTPMWVAMVGDAMVARSAASDGKIKRIRRDGAVRIAPCTLSGRPLTAPMEGTARLLEDPTSRAQAEAALRDRLGLLRRLYSLFRDPVLEPAYIEVTARAA